MDTIYGLTLDRTNKLTTLMKEIIYLPKRPTIRLICDEPGSGFEWQQLVDPIRKLSDCADIMLMILDSQYLAQISPRHYRDRAQKALDYYGEHVKIFEVGNEIGGEWIGSDDSAVQKCTLALEVFEQAKKWSAVTWYYDGNYPDRFFNVIKKMHIPADFQLVSWYPYYSPTHRPDWNNVFQKLANEYPGRRYGFGEFGTEHELHGEEVVAKPLERAGLCAEIYRLSPPVAGYIGGGFYWRGWQDVLSRTKNQEVRNAIQKAWR